MSLAKTIGVAFIQCCLSIAIFLISQPIFFEIFRNSDPNDSITLTILILGVIIATLAGVIVFAVVYKRNQKKNMEILGISGYFTISLFLIIGYYQIFTDKIWTYPWWQILSIAISAPNYFWVLWCIIFSVFCALFAQLYNIDQEVIIK